MYIPAHVVGLAAKTLSLVPKQSLTASQLLTTKARGMPRRMMNTGPYISAKALRVLTRGTGARRRWRWPKIGHAPPASGGDLLLLVLVFLRHERLMSSNRVARARAKMEEKYVETSMADSILTFFFFLVYMGSTLSYIWVLSN